jgi:hypothetical protein
VRVTEHTAQRAESCVESTTLECSPGEEANPSAALAKTLLLMMSACDTHTCNRTRSNRHAAAIPHELSVPSLRLSVSLRCFALPRCSAASGPEVPRCTPTTPVRVEMSELLMLLLMMAVGEVLPLSSLPHRLRSNTSGVLPLPLLPPPPPPPPSLFPAGLLRLALHQHGCQNALEHSHA